MTDANYRRLLARRPRADDLVILTVDKLAEKIGQLFEILLDSIQARLAQKFRTLLQSVKQRRASRAAFPGKSIRPERLFAILEIPRRLDADPTDKCRIDPISRLFRYIE